MGTYCNNSLAYEILKKRKANNYLTHIDGVASNIEPVLNGISKHFNSYTLHDMNHSIRVLNMMCEIAGEENLNKLSDLELAMIIYVALLHDIGMFVFEEEKEQIEKDSRYKYYLEKNNGDKDLAIQDYIRPIHGIRSYQYIMETPALNIEMASDDLSTVSYAKDVALICQSHMESISWIDNNLQEFFTKGDYFNSKYIALLLRIADYIDFDSQRAPKYLFKHKQLNEVSLTEWQKHAAITNYKKIMEDTNEIYFHITCSDFEVYCKLMDTFELIRKEILESVQYAKNFKYEKYHLRIKEDVSIKITTEGFTPEIASFNMDYYKISKLLMGENLYGKKEYGFREILQNCFDACNTMKAYYSNNPSIRYEPQVSIIYDYDDNKVIIKDNGIGMSSHIIHKYFLTIGNSYYQSDEFKELGYGIHPTGTFGIGFLSCFMLSEKVTVTTKYYSTCEVISFSMGRNSRYLCFEEADFEDIHGTSIALSMNEFKNVFTKESLLSFIESNFYRLDAPVVIYEKRFGKVEAKEHATAERLTNSMSIDISSYLNGIECKAELSTILEYFIVHDTFPYADVQGSNVVLFTYDGIKLVKEKLLHIYSQNKCIFFNSFKPFEMLAYNTYKNREYRSVNYSEIDEVLDDFSQYGFDVFDPDFDRYNGDYRQINFLDMLEDGVWIIWDESFDITSVNCAMNELKLNYLNNMQSLLFKDTYIYDFDYMMNKKNIYDTIHRYREVEFLDAFNNVGYCDIKIFHMGVYLENVHLEIPFIANIVNHVRIAANIIADGFEPSVTRMDLTLGQKKSLAYALGRTIHRYLVDFYKEDEFILSPLKLALEAHYPKESIFCKLEDK